MGETQLAIPAQPVAYDLVRVLLNDGRPLCVDRERVDDLLLIVRELVAQIVEALAQVEFVRLDVWRVEVGDGTGELGQVGQGSDRAVRVWMA